MKYRSTLTEENVAYLNKLDQYTASRPDAGARSSSGARRAAPPVWAPGPGLRPLPLLASAARTSLRSLEALNGPARRLGRRGDSWRPARSGLPATAPSALAPTPHLLTPAGPALQSGYGGGWRAPGRRLTTHPPAWACPP